MNFKLTAFSFMLLFGGPQLWAESEAPGDSIQTQEIQQEEVTEDIKQAQDIAESELAEREKLAKDAQKKSDESISVVEKALSNYLALLQAYRAELSELKLSRIKNMDLAINQMKEKAESLKKINDLTLENLNQASDIWRNIVDITISQLFETDQIEIKNPPASPPGVSLRGEKFPELRELITQTLAEIEVDQEQLRTDIDRLSKSERNVRSGLLLNSGRIRSNLMNALISNGQFSAWSISENEISDYLRELKIVPYRFIATFTQKYFEFNSLSQQGPSGWFEILKQLVLIFLVLGLPFLIFRAFRVFSQYLEDTRKQIFTKSQMDVRSRTRLALWIGRVNPYLPWLFAFAAITIAKEILLGTILEPLALVLPYLGVYVGYRVFRIVFSTVLARVLLSKSLDSVRNKQPKVEETAYKLSLLFFIELAVLYATQDAVRQALIYNIISDLIIVVNVLVIAFESRKWKSELLLLSKAWLKPKWIETIENNNKPALDLLFCPLLFAGDIGYLILTWAYNWLGQFEIGKKVSSEIFKKRLEEAAEESGETEKSVPPEYRALFESENISEDTRVTISRTPLQKCLAIIDKWQNGPSKEDLILLYSNFGIGKTSILNALEAKLKPKLSVKRVRLENRISKSAELFKLISELIGSEIQNTGDLEALDGTMDKTLLIIDDIHNLYLNEVNGLSAYRSLINLTSLQLENIFWCFTCNERSLAHLNGIFGANHFLGESIELLSWTDGEIQDLILKRHNKSNLKIKFDQIISAVHKGDILEASSGLEVQFFRMLWGQSRGNPRTAQELWLTATNLTRKNTIRVSVPDFTNARDLSEFSDETLLLFGSIVKHENLTYRDLKKVSGLKESALKQALKQGEDGLILQKIGPQKWRVHPKAQYVVHSQLAGRNLIYG